VKVKIMVMKNKIKAFIRDQDGLTIVEYAVAGGLISAVVAGTFMALGVTVNGVIVTLNAAIGG
jgi:pilus assembly protein Flp/PilA